MSGNPLVQVLRSSHCMPYVSMTQTLILTSWYFLNVWKCPSQGNALFGLHAIFINAEGEFYFNESEFSFLGKAPIQVNELFPIPYLSTRTQAFILMSGNARVHMVMRCLHSMHAIFSLLTLTFILTSWYFLNEGNAPRQGNTLFVLHAIFIHADVLTSCFFLNAGKCPGSG